MRIERAALTVAEDRRRDLAGCDVTLVDAASVLMAGEGFEFAEGFGDCGFVGSDEADVAAEEGLDGNGFGCVEDGIVAGAARGFWRAVSFSPVTAW